MKTTSHFKYVKTHNNYCHVRRNGIMSAYKSSNVYSNKETIQPTTMSRQKPFQFNKHLIEKQNPMFMNITPRSGTSIIHITNNKCSSSPLDDPPQSFWGTIGIFIGMTFAWGLSTAINRTSSTHYYKYPTHDTTSKIITIKKPTVDYTAGLSNIPFATCDIGSIGGLTPTNFGIPYHGKNPAIALFMASAGVSLRMAINVGVIYCIYQYWLKDNPDDNNII